MYIFFCFVGDILYALRLVLLSFESKVFDMAFMRVGRDRTGKLIHPNTSINMEHQQHTLNQVTGNPPTVANPHQVPSSKIKG